jgi:hypothetical protein
MFIAPEYEVGRVENVTEKGDIFSIGKIIWCMINGEENFVFPSNLWFLDEFDLMKKFPTDSNMIIANVIISSCLNINPEDRCNYFELIEMISDFLEKKEILNDEVKEKNYKIKLFQEKRRIESTAKFKKNNMLVECFYKYFDSTLEFLMEQYNEFEILKKLYAKKNLYRKDEKEYIKNEIIGAIYINFVDGISMVAQYFPANNGEKLGYIEFKYEINSKNIKKLMKIKYDERDILICEVDNKSCVFNEGKMREFFNSFIQDYIE